MRRAARGGPRRSTGGRRRRVLAPLALLLGAVLLAGCSSAPDDGGFTFVAPGGETQISYDPASSRQPLAPVAGDSLLEPGRTLSSADYRGQVVVLNIWGSWCGPCRGEAPALEEVAEASRPNGVQFLGVAVRDTREPAADFVRDRAVSYPSIFDPPGRSLLALRGYPRNAVPSTIVLDRQGRVAAVFLTAVLASDLQPVVDRIAAETYDTA